MEDWQNFGEDYDKTLMAWYGNFKQAWPDLRNRYGERFFRMWEFYLLSSAGGFRSRSMQLWQIIMTLPGTPWKGRTRPTGNAGTNGIRFKETTPGKTADQ
jgi:cyclopropane-fatty-acyl-phospholipid synthase